jgi:hypothetical protein
MNADTSRLTMLDHLDVELAKRIDAACAGYDADLLAARALPFVEPRVAERREWIAGILGLRGFETTTERVSRVLEGREHEANDQERVLIQGLDQVFGRLLERARDGELPDGWFVFTLFQVMTRHLPRFANNHLRRDAPWDALLHVPYPAPLALGGLLDDFTAASRYRDVPQIHALLHPVRRSFRLCWRFARIAPFPDFNLVFAFIGMNAHQLALGYPLLIPDAKDRPLLEALIKGPPPRRIVQYEARLALALR